MPRLRRVVSLILSVALLVAVSVAWLQRQAIYDWARLRDYQPSAAVSQLATDGSLTDRARRIFFVQHPQVEPKSTFNNDCRNNELTIVLGCYISGQGIYVLKVDDARLKGVEQVTAAHEMLHAAYERLSDKERQRIGQLLDDAFEAVTDQRIKTTIDLYRQSGADVTNELHSILGTEVKRLPSELETYYKQYFLDRHTVVGLSEQYQQEFTNRKNKVEEADTRLKSLKADIESKEATLDVRSEELQTARAQLDQLRTSGQLVAYNAGVPGFNAKVDAYNNLAKQTRSLIDQFNLTLSERNAIALEERQLFEAIDSRPSVQQSE